MSDSKSTAGLSIPVPVPSARAASYRASGWWDGRRLADGIEAAAASRPDAVAVSDDRRRLSWVQLERAVAGAVDHFAAEGISAGDGLVLVTGNTVDGAVAFHAALRVGACVLMLDRRVGAADVRVALDVLPGRPRSIVPRAQRELLVPPAADVIELERVAEHARSARWSEPDRDAAALVMLTSGTTGTPKAVVHSINTATAGAANMARITGCGPNDVLFLVSPLASITGAMQLLLAADQHAGLVLVDDFDPDRALTRIDELRATILGGAPVIAERLLDAAQRRGAHVGLRVLSLGGAMLPQPLLELATDRFGIQIARVYGSSEAPNFTGSTPADDRVRRLADDGELMPGSEVRVGSSSHAEEGLLRGPGVFLGYVDPADNAASFDGEWFRTGDLVELRDDRLTVTGRLKDVVNRNGLKVSPAEIDQALAGMPDVVEHACFGLPDPDTGERLAVAIRPAAGSTVTLGDVVAHLTASGIATRKLPEQLVVWDGPLPRTTSGKVVRSQLVRLAGDKRSDLAARLR